MLREHLTELNAFTSEKNKELFEAGKKYAYLSDEDNKPVNISFDDKYIADRIYGPQIHVLKGKIVRMPEKQK